MASPNIFQQYLRPVRSVADFGAEMDRAEMARLQLEGQQGQNALQQVTRQQTMANMQREQARRNKLAALAQQYQDPAAFEEAALKNPMTYDIGKQRRADRLTADKTAAEVAKAREESEALKLQRSIQELGVHATARDAIASLDADQTIPPGFKAALRARFEAAGDDANAYKATLYDLILSRAKPAEQAAAMAPQKPEKAPSPTTLARLIAERDALPANDPRRKTYDAAISKETSATPAASIINYGSPVPVQLPDGKVGYVQPSNRGGPAAPMADAGGKPLVKPSDADTKALTEGQAKAVAFASRMESADKVMADLSRRGVLTTIPGGMGNNAVGSAITAVSSADQQKLMQAKRNFINAVLRRESGAVISADEFANAERQYFPQIGDSRPVIEQKARERRVAIEGMRADVPSGRQGEVDRISGGGDVNNDPLGLRGR